MDTDDPSDDPGGSLALPTAEACREVPSGFRRRTHVRPRAIRVTELFSEPSRRRLGAALGLDEAVAKNVPQQSLRRLQDADLVLRMDYGDYRVQDDAFIKA